MERNERLIRKKIYKYMLNGVMITAAIQLGNVVDAMIVGNLLGSLANGAVSAATPYLYTMQAAAILLGTGGSVTVAVLLGKRDTAGAGSVMGVCMLVSVVYPLIFTILSPVLVPAFVRMTGASGELGEMIHGITTVYSIGMPVFSFVLVMAYLMTVDNHPALSARLHITANAVNLALDFILVSYTPLGIKGAALSTILGYLIGGLIFIPQYFRSKNRMVTPVIKINPAIRPLIVTTCKNGLPNLVYLFMLVISVSIINAKVLQFLGSAYFSAYAVGMNTQLIVQMILNGITSVIASVAGALYGEKDYYGIRHVFSRVLRIALLAGCVIMLLFLLFPQCLAALYGFDNDAIRPELYTGLRIFSLSFLFFILNAIAQNYYRTTGQTFLSTLSTAMELLLIKVPLMLLGMHLFGFIGLFGAIIFSELISFLLLNLVRVLMQKAGRVPQKGFLAIPDHDSGEICDMTVTGSDETAVDVSARIIAYCMKDNLPASKAQALGVAAEELISNIGRYGYKSSKEKYIDVCLSKAGGKYYLRLRDDGVPFDPVHYEPREHEPYEIGGLELIRKMSVELNYMRVINLNNTIIVIEP